MATNIVRDELPENIAKEFSLSDDGRGLGFVSRRGLAKMCGVSHPAILKLLKTISAGNQTTPKMLQSFAGQSFEGGNQIPDILASAIVKHYAYQGKEVAQATDFALGAIGLRTLIQNALNYVPNEKLYTIDMVVRRSPASWERMFQRSWIEQAEKLTRWKWEWSCMGGFINDAIYAYLPTDVVEAIKDLNPKNEDGRGRVHKHHQFLQPEFREILVKHLDEVELLMRAAKGNMELFQMLMVNHFGRFKLSGEDELPLFKTQTMFIVNNN